MSRLQFMVDTVMLLGANDSEKAKDDMTQVLTLEQDLAEISQTALQIKISFLNKPVCFKMFQLQVSHLNYHLYFKLIKN